MFGWILLLRRSALNMVFPKRKSARSFEDGLYSGLLRRDIGRAKMYMRHWDGPEQAGIWLYSFFTRQTGVY